MENQNTENLTSWRKNLDSRYISGEDLMSGLRGLKSEMIVIIERFTDSETFDQAAQKNEIKTGFYLREVDGQPLHKPLILNKINARFCEKEFNSQYMEHWIGKPIVLYAQKDRRHGYVARFKKYYPNQQQQAPVQPQVKPEDIKFIKEQFEMIGQLSDLQSYYVGLDAIYKSHPEVIAAKDEAKTRLS